MTMRYTLYPMNFSFNCRFSLTNDKNYAFTDAINDLTIVVLKEGRGDARLPQPEARHAPRLSLEGKIYNPFWNVDAAAVFLLGFEINSPRGLKGVEAHGGRWEPRYRSRRVND